MFRCIIIRPTTKCNLSLNGSSTKKGSATVKVIVMRDDELIELKLKIKNIYTD